LLTIASSEDATIAARRAADSSGRNDIRVLCPTRGDRSEGRAGMKTDVRLRRDTHASASAGDERSLTNNRAAAMRVSI
jgi:hypothetical protein